jgi:hypothetical protein
VWVDSAHLLPSILFARLVRAMFFEPGIYDSPSRVAALATSLIF